MQIRLDPSSPSRQIVVDEGEEIILFLAENPTTGYRWRVQQEGDGSVETLGDCFRPPSGSALGAGGMHEFRYRAARPGKVALCFTESFVSGAASSDPVCKLEVAVLPRAR